MMWIGEASVSILLASRIRWRDVGIQSNPRALYTTWPSRGMRRTAHLSRQTEAIELRGSCRSAPSVVGYHAIGVAITALDHVQLAMPLGKEAEARAFYEGVLGIPEIVKPPNLAARGGCWFQRGALKVHLGVEPEFRPARKAHPAFLVQDLPALVSAITAAGLVVKRDEALDGYERVFIDDPFGNRIELLEPASNPTTFFREPGESDPA